MVQFEQFIPFFGLVEDVLDPMKIGRVRVRAYGFHSDNPGVLPTEQLPWLSQIVPNSGSMNGYGISPTGVMVGTTVFGFFVDKTFQTGIVIGALAGMTNNVPDVSGLATGSGVGSQIAQLRELNRVQGVQGPAENTEEEDEEELKKKRWSEPPYVNNASYPNNHVFETPTGLVREMDGTPGAERIHEYHPSGSYYEVSAEGDRVVKVVGDGYEIIAGAKNIYIRGNVNETIEGNYTQYIKGNMITQVDGTRTLIVQGENSEFYGDSYEQATGTKTTVASTLELKGNLIDAKAGKILLNE